MTKRKTYTLGLGALTLRSTAVLSAHQISSRPVAAIAVAGCCLAATWLVNDYAIAFLLFVAAAFAVCLGVHTSTRLLFVIIAVYLVVGLPNISNWRGYIEIETLRLYASGLVLMALPSMMLSRSDRLSEGMLHSTSTARVAIAVHLAIAMALTGYVYATRGIVFLQQDIRFSVSPLIGYITRSTVPLAALAPFFFRRSRSQAFIAIAAVLPALLMGSRGTASIGILSFVLARRYSGGFGPLLIRARSRRGLMIAAGLACAAIIAGGFVIRRSSNTALASVPELAATYFDYQGWWIYPLMPFHLGFREAVGLSNAIVARGIRGEPGTTPLFIADLVTVLPGEQVAAGQALGSLFGTVEAGGLTPGLLGGTYIDFGSGSLLVFLGVGMTLAFFARLGHRRLAYTSVYVVVLTQLLHLFHRGFLKPEYITTVLITVAYAALIRRVRA